MNNVWILLKVQLMSFFGINKAIHLKSEKEKDKIIYLLIGGIIVLFTMGVLSSVVSYGIGAVFKSLNITEMLLAIMLSAISLIILFTTAIKANGALFGCGDYNMIMSLPIKTSHIIMSKILTLYVLNFILSSLIMVPAGVVYGILESMSTIYYIVFGITLFIIPLIPLVIAMILGSLIAFISTRFKYKNLVNTILTFMLVITIMGVSLNINKIEHNIGDIGKALGNSIYKIYPLSKVYVKGICEQDILSLLIFIGLSIGIFVLFSNILSLKFKDINSKIISKSASGNYEIKDLKISSPFKALYKKELKRYFSSTLYVVNTGIGVIFLIAASIAICVIPSAKIEEIFQVPNILDVIKSYAPFMFSIFIVISCTTNSSISLEGKSMWILKSLPIKVNLILLSKIAVNLTILIPAIFICSIMLSLKLEMNVIQSILLFIMPCVFAFFISIFGIVVNLKFPNLEWTNEVTPIKQSMSVFITMITGVILVGILVGATIKIESLKIDLVILIITLVLTLVTIILYKIMNKIGEETFKKL